MLLKNFLSILFLYFGIVAGVFAAYEFGFHFYVEYLSPLVLIYCCIAVVNILQLSIMVLLLRLFAKRIGKLFFMSIYNNFIIGICFSIVYSALLFIIPTKIDCIDNWWFNLLILPVISLVPIVLIELLMCQYIKKKGFFDNLILDSEKKN